jgi:hypothetical protein
MADIFISYERSDYAKAQKIAEALGQRGLSVWWDRMLLAGDRFDKTIQQALHAAKCVIVLWSKTSISSDWVKDEAFEGAKRGILVPVLIDDVEIPFGLRQIHAARLTNWEASSLPPEFREVLNSVAQVLSRVRALETTLDPAGPTSAVPGREQTGTPVRSSASEVSNKRESRSWRRVLTVRGVFTLVAVIVIVCGLLGTLGYFLRPETPQPQKESSSRRSLEDASPGTELHPGGAELVHPGGTELVHPGGTELVHPGGTELVQPGGTEHPSGIVVGTFEFNWPGNDDWQIYRGEQVVAGHFGSAKQTLQAGTYTIKPQNYPVFNPFEVSIKSGSTTKIEIGGILEFDWPGNDDWQIFRGEQVVVGHFGSAKQALQAGTYTIKPQNYPVFNPFEVQISDGGKTIVP